MARSPRGGNRCHCWRLFHFQHLCTRQFFGDTGLGRAFDQRGQLGEFHGFGVRLHINRRLRPHADSIATISGYKDVTGEQLTEPTSDSNEVLLGCDYASGSLDVGIFAIDIQPADPNKTAQQYLSDTIPAAMDAYFSSVGPIDGKDLGLFRDVPGLGDAAKFGTVESVKGSCVTVRLIQIRSGKVIDLVVGIDESSGAEDPVVRLAKTLLASVTN